MARIQEIDKHLADGVAPDKLDKLMNDHGFVGPFKDSIYVCPHDRAVVRIGYGQICGYKVMEAEEFIRYVRGLERKGDWGKFLRKHTPQFTPPWEPINCRCWVDPVIVREEIGADGSTVRTERMRALAYPDESPARGWTPKFELAPGLLAAKSEDPTKIMIMGRDSDKQFRPDELDGTKPIFVCYSRAGYEDIFFDGERYEVSDERWEEFKRWLEA